MQNKKIQLKENGKKEKVITNKYQKFNDNNL